MDLARRGLRKMDAPTERIEDAAELRRVRKQARKVHVESILIALLLTAIAVLIPV